MKKIFTREVKIGLLVAVSGLILYFGFNFLKGINLFNPTNYYQAPYSELDGLTENAPVFIRGLKVGQVSKIEYDFSQQRAFIVTLDIAKDIRLPVGTRAQLFDDGLVGGKAINLLCGEFTGQYLAVGDMLASSEEIDMVTQISNRLLPKIDYMLASGDTLINSLRAIVEGKNLQNSMQNIEHATANFEKSSDELSQLMQHDVPGIVGNVNQITGNLTVISENVSKVDFAGTATKIDQTMNELQSVTQKINSGEGSLGLLINDRQLYNNLNQTTLSADSLLSDLKNNPKRYIHFSIFGKK
ncbi:MAG: MlaD family protein [Prevotellaceae bacterium]|jgi:phospholipid/cholesterol/gamma-HCH transport system substrate-binding protein|nr:MlaD family protein [Prevotellaceae bacterium]